MQAYEFRAFNSTDKEWYGDEVAKLLLYRESLGEKYDRNKWTIVQYTGLRDKGGIGEKIFDRDCFTGDREKIGVVTWVHDKWVVEFTEHQYSVPLYEYIHQDKSRVVAYNEIAFKQKAVTTAKKKKLNLKTVNQLVDEKVLNPGDRMVLLDSEGRPLAVTTYTPLSTQQAIPPFAMIDYCTKVVTLRDLEEKDHLYIVSGSRVSPQERYMCQKGKFEAYCPEVGQNTMGHSKGGGEEVYLQSTEAIKKPITL